jgi:hypothetical protein
LQCGLGNLSSSIVSLTVGEGPVLHSTPLWTVLCTIQVFNKPLLPFVSAAAIWLVQSLFITHAISLT